MKGPRPAPAAAAQTTTAAIIASPSTSTFSPTQERSLEPRDSGAAHRGAEPASLEAAYLSQSREQSTDELVRALCPAGDAGQATDSAEDTQTVPILIAQGNSYLARGQHPFDPGMLSEDVSSAFGAFQSALNLAPDQCDAAAHGIARVAAAYRREAQRLYAAGEYRKAAAMAAIGLRIWKDNREMHTVFEQASRKLPPKPPGP